MKHSTEDRMLIRCPECKGENTLIIGQVRTRTELKTRYKCKGCGKSFYPVARSHHKKVSIRPADFVEEPTETDSPLSRE